MPRQIVTRKVIFIRHLGNLFRQKQLKTLKIHTLETKNITHTLCLTKTKNVWTYAGHFCSESNVRLLFQALGTQIFKKELLQNIFTTIRMICFVTWPSL